MPLPVSSTEIRIASASRASSSSMLPPRGVYLTAFETRFVTTRSSATGSTLAISLSGSVAVSSRPGSFCRRPPRREQAAQERREIGRLRVRA